ncbi:MAG: hypothetical protein MUO31_04225 [Thermodesulfovibrionales bacterium]|nr:hypothetical protein [Thermodesulfovibrionales bacterium]
MEKQQGLRGQGFEGSRAEEQKSEEQKRKNAKRIQGDECNTHKYKDFVEKEHPERTIDLLRAKWHTRDG